MNAYLHQAIPLIPTIYLADDQNAQSFVSIVKLEWWKICQGVERVGDPIIRIGKKRRTFEKIIVLITFFILSVPCSNGSEVMDMSVLQRFISEDESAGSTPCLVIGRAGTPVTGELDDIQSLTHVCSRHHMVCECDPLNFDLLIIHRKTLSYLVVSCRGVIIDCLPYLQTIPFLDY